nr:MAG TPA_asm: tail tape measure protein [Bacteriophage sp.]
MPFGQAATRITLVTTALTGLYHILQSYMGFMKGGAIFGAVSGVVSTIKGLIETQSLIKEAQAAAALKNHAAESALTFLQADADKAIISLKALAANFAITAGFAAAFALAIKAGTAKFDAYNDAVNKTAEEQSKLASYKDELADLESRTDTLTEAERHRLDVLREITAEQEKQVQATKQAEYEAYSEAYGSGAGVATGTSGAGSGGIGGWGRVESVQRDVYQLTEYQRQLNDLQQQYANQTKDSAMSTGEYYAALQNLNDGYADTIEKLRDFIEVGIEVTDSERALVMAYDEAQIALGNVGTSIQIVTDAYTQLTNSGEISKATWETLIAYYPQLANGAVQTANGYQIQESALLNLMSAEQRQQAEITNLVNGFIAEAQQAGKTGQAMYEYAASLVTASNTQLNVSQQIAALQALALQAGYTAQDVANAFSFMARLSNAASSSSSIIRSAAGKTLKNAVSNAWGNLTTNYTPSVSKVSTPSYTPSTTTPSTSKPSSGSGTSNKTSTYDDSKRSEAQAQIKQLQAQQDVIQDKIDAVNEKYDAQLKELEDINDALEEQIQLQKLLQALTEAKASKKMVFKDGRFQYLSDVDAIAKAQSNLEDFYKEQELKKQKKRIEEERQAELKGLQAEKEYLQRRIDEWRSFLSSMSSNYSSGLTDLGNYVSQWNSYVDSMKQPSTSTGGGSSSGGGGTSGGSTGGGSSTPSDSSIAKKNAAISAKYPSKSYNTSHNGEYDKSTTKKIQTWYGTPADGVWGRNSYAAAGNRNIDAAAGLYYAVKGTYGGFAAFKRYGGYAIGTLSSRRGMSMVGEQGPELRVLNQGDGIIPAKQTATLWSFANDPTKFLQNLNNIGGKTDIFNIANVSLPNVQNPQEFISGLRNLAYQRTYKPNFGTV